MQIEHYDKSFLEKIFSPTEINEFINRILNDLFNENIKIQGEITNLSRSSLGHVFFSLKDVKNSLIGCVCWKSFIALQKKNKEFIEFFNEGSEIVCSGKLSNFNGKIQLSVNKIEIINKDGALFLEFEKTKKRLAELGFFDVSRKKPLPKYPKNICLLTSRSGAVLQDMLNRIKDRFPVNVSLIHVPVQGKSSVNLIIKALNFVNKKNFDVLILARGGGSFEELSIFNDENLVKTISILKTPIISAIGHETDFTLSDFVSDLRAPTPSSAIEICLPLKKDLENYILNISAKIYQNFFYKISGLKNHFNILKKNLSKEAFLNKIEKYKIHIKFLVEQIRSKIIQKKNDLESRMKISLMSLKRFDYKELLNKGFVLCWKNFDQNNDLIRTKKEFEDFFVDQNNKNLYLEFSDGICEIKQNKI